MVCINHNGTSNKGHSSSIISYYTLLKSCPYFRGRIYNTNRDLFALGKNSVLCREVVSISSVLLQRFHPLYYIQQVQMVPRCNGSSFARHYIGCHSEECCGARRVGIGQKTKQIEWNKWTPLLRTPF